MAKVSKKEPALVDEEVQQAPAAQEPFVPAPGIPGWMYEFKIQAVIIALLAFVFYFNTTHNGYVLDDTLVIVQNEYVLEGIAGIPAILSKDNYDSYYRQIGSSDQVPGGRYRPLSIVTFAIEQQFFGAIAADKVDSVMHQGLTPEMTSPYEQKFLHDMHVRHLFNVLWFIASVIALLYFLRYVVFRSNPLIAFVAVILFTIHPIHTEVLANVKSRDEILSLLFICLTFIFAFKYKEHRKYWQLSIALVCYFLAFLSKEYAISLLALLPLAFYLFRGEPVKKMVISMLPYVAVVVVYVLIRLYIVSGMPPKIEMADNDIQINPYAFASHNEQVATEIATSLNYLKLLFFPHPLSADYSYNQIPYKDFSHPLVWLSLIVHIGLIAGFVFFFYKRNVLCFGIAFYLVNLLMICNLVFSIGATMGERLIYHASVGFVICVAYLLYSAMERIKPIAAGRVGFAGLMLLLILLCGFTTIRRNADWESDYTLFSHDINVVPNSFLVNMNVATSLVNKSDLIQDEKKRTDDVRRGLGMFSKVIAMQHNYVLAYMNRTVAYLKLGMTDSAKADLDKVRSLYPIHPQLPEMYFHVGEQYLYGRQFDKGYITMQQVLKLRPDFYPARRAVQSMDSARAAGQLQ